MTHRMAFLSAAAICVAAIPHAAAAADYDEDAGRAAAYGRAFGGGDARAEGFDRGPGLHPADRRGPGPVVFDERDPDRHGDRGRFDEGVPRGDEGGPMPFGRPAFPAGRFGGPEVAYGWAPHPLPRYRVVGVPRDPEAFDVRAGRPDAGCTTEQAESITPAGWRKIVTHRTCYRR